MNDEKEQAAAKANVMADDSFDSSLIVHPSSLLPVPAPRCGAIEVRLATAEDIPFMDGLQKLHQKQLGFMPRKTFEGKIAAGHVLVAWASRPCSSDGKDMAGTAMLRKEPLGY